ncbi:hypothetical protein BHU72_06165 [Desulfuribacillus stibiiarsenatis]|uniref:Lipoprotein YerB n=1 Tax=Desulfuribacillus stibiiarsenatis TaxID=1390249 RepID=A0A1E5L501_9FIRM|nr:DUF3048 domain-containing protein [Desulfuribacillus stibiiarsenatis]OEH85191.1 hypothetical protein BHU72_06165 [Desulfuribacillus stibiiarsenatis]
MTIQRKASWQKKLIIILFAFVLLFAFAGCKKDEQTSVDPTSQEPESPRVEEKEPKSENKQPEYKYKAPLTNMGVEKEVNNRPIAVFVENSPNARPQSGLDKADIVYEVMAEGGITRFIGIFQSQKPETIGPIRSAREYMLDIANDYDAVIVHAGGSPGALSRIQKEKLPSISEIINGSYFKREKFRKAPHNVYSNIDLLTKGAQTLKFRDNYTLPSLSFRAEGQEVQGTVSKEFVIPYGNIYQVKYIYDEEKQRYQRFINNEPHADMTSKEQLTANNILVAYARHNIVDKVGRIDINLKTTGKGFAFQEGKMIDVTWRHVNGMMRFYNGNDEIALMPGNTWIQIVPDVITVNVQK